MSQLLGNWPRSDGSVEQLWSEPPPRSVWVSHYKRGELPAGELTLIGWKHPTRRRFAAAKRRRPSDHWWPIFAAEPPSVSEDV